ncbi:hypothetical protein F4779DRAFT_618395 [Xylariaceae sp. FL0662B]|nr:hypothetical protein F4779DRAFT_618395 [Xylariaceae sp. FL0662B]
MSKTTDSPPSSKSHKPVDTLSGEGYFIGPGPSASIPQVDGLPSEHQAPPYEQNNQETFGVCLESLNAAYRFSQEHARFESLEQQIQALEKRNEEILERLDSVYPRRRVAILWNVFVLVLCVTAFVFAVASRVS